MIIKVLLIEGTVEGQQTLDELLSSSEYNLPPPLINTILYAIALSPHPSVSTRLALKGIKRHLSGFGVYGAFPLIVPLHGGGGELCQAFCRSSAVKGGTYILGRGIRSVTKVEGDGNNREEGFKVVFDVEEGDELPEVYCKHVVRETDTTNMMEATAEVEETRSIVIVEGVFEKLFGESGFTDAAMIVIPSGTVRKEQAMPIQIILHGGGIGECPPGQCTPLPFSPGLLCAECRGDVLQYPGRRRFRSRGLTIGGEIDIETGF